MKKTAWLCWHSYCQINTYSYVGDNSLRYMNPTGLNAVIGAIVGVEVGTMIWPAPGIIIAAGLEWLRGYLIADKLS